MTFRDHLGLEANESTPWTPASYADYLAHVRSEASQTTKLQAVSSRLVLAIIERRRRELGLRPL